MLSNRRKTSYSIPKIFLSVLSMQGTVFSTQFFSPSEARISSLTSGSLIASFPCFQISLGVTQLLSSLAQSPLGAVAINDFRRQQFVSVNGEIKLSDVDDMSFEEPTCDSNASCEHFFSSANFTLKYVFSPIPKQTITMLILPPMSKAAPRLLRFSIIVGKTANKSEG